jgi:hypothetical protein
LHISRNVIRPAIALFAALGTAQAATVYGFVRDSASGEPLAFASVYLSDRSAGTATGRNGYYVLSGLPSGKVTAVWSLVGHRDVRRELVLAEGASVRSDVRLAVEAIAVSGVTASAKRERFRREVDIGVRRLDLPDLKMAPGMIEQDLFKSLQMLPGVLAVSDFASALYVRGGSPDQNLVLLDGVTVYNPYHLGGLFSTFNMDALAGAELKAGAFPAEYGGAVSSVLDVEMKQGNSERLSGKWDVGLLTSKLMFEGPIPRGSFLVAGRRTYIDAVTWTVDRLIRDSTISVYLPYYFYDLQGKLNFDASDRDRLTFSGYSGDDVIDIKDEFDRLNFRWGNYALALKWRHIFSPRLVATTMAVRGRNRVSLLQESFPQDTTWGDSSRTELNFGVSDWGVKSDWTLFLDSTHTPRVGFEGKLFELRNLLKSDTLVYWDQRSSPLYGALYAADKWRPVEPLLLDAGVRVEFFSGGGYLRASPRVGAKYLLADDFALTAGWGLYYQYLSIPFPRNDELVKLPALFFQQWLPCDSAHAPVEAMHWALGVQKGLGHGFEASLEAYYKSMRNLLETRSFLPGVVGDPGGEDTATLAVGTGWAAGAEVLVQRQGSSISYSLAFTRRTFDSTGFWPVFDSRHNLNIGLALPLKHGWGITSQFAFRSGFPFTGPVGQFQYVGETPGWRGVGGDDETEWYSWTPIGGRRGNYRLPAYHRLDLGFEKRFRLWRADWAVYLQVVNVYAAKNVLWYDYYTDENGRIVREPFVLLPVPIPSFGIRGGF